jgi:DNA-binding response OmpR family regulator
MISETHPDVRRLLERMIARAGDKSMVVDAPTPAKLRSADVLIVDTAAPHGAMLAQLARAASPSLPIVCASVAPPSRELAEVVGFGAVLVKPYTAEQLQAAIDQVLPESSSAAAASATPTVGAGSSVSAKNASTRPHASRAASGR